LSDPDHRSFGPLAGGCRVSKLPYYPKGTMKRWAVYSRATDCKVAPEGDDYYEHQRDAILEARRLSGYSPPPLRLVPRPERRCGRCGLLLDFRDALTACEESCRCSVAGVTVRELLARKHDA
jgi:hypothetical protein